MSQVEKFNKRVAQATKVYNDERAIKENEIKSSTIENVGHKVAKQYGYTTEDIFMIIARDSMEVWSKMWNNSMENVVRETLRTEVKAIVKDVVQDELAQAVRGFMRGMAMAQMEQIVEEEVEEQIAYDIEPFETPEQHMSEPEIEYAASEPAVAEREEQIFKIEDKERLDRMILELRDLGIDPSISKDVKNVGGTYSTLYQRFVKHNPGRGLWKQYVQSILNENN
jgi:hypothetical protein